ncbi:MAG: 16S rRNA (cytidine(1402)-2'-O)-methyltransferase [Pseudomonadota bacterium]
MTLNQAHLAAGLYVVATPMGSARDITLRALDVLASVDVLVAEDTRVLKRLLELHGIALSGRPIWSYHDHSKASDRAKVVQAIEAGKSVAYASDAGTPLIADPGYQLAKSVQDAGLAMTSLPGPSAVTNALVLAGLPTNSFHFAGFLPPQGEARKTTLTALRQIGTTLVIYETPKRLAASLSAITEIFSPAQDMAICREMTKRFETISRGTVGDLIQDLPNMVLKGEIVLVIGPANLAMDSAQDVDQALVQALLTMRVKDAAHAVAGAMGLPKRDVYQRALALKQDSPD